MMRTRTLPLRPLAGGEGWGEMGRSGSGTPKHHLTLPIAGAMGPLPLPREAAERARWR
jgi:hypothetical protein